MKPYQILFAAIVTTAFTSTSVLAAEKNYDAKEVKTEHGAVTIEWQNPDRYRDIKVVSGKQSRYEQQVFERLTEGLDREATKILKENQTLHLVVTDVDLAGDVRPTFGATPNDIRVVKDVYPPRMTFSYQVVDNDQVVIAGNEKLSKLGFMGSSSRMNGKPFRHEVDMLKDWLNKSVKPML